MTRFPVVVKILGVSEHDILAHERKSLVENLLHAGQFTRVEKIRRVYRYFQVGGAYLIQKAPCFPG